MLDKDDNLMGYVFLYSKRYIVLDHPTVGERSNFKNCPTHTQDHGDA